MRHRRNENQHGQNWGTSFFKKPWSVHVASEWKDTEAGREVQVFWDCIYVWRKARRRNGYPNQARLECSNASFAKFGCHETRIVKKSKALNFQNSFCPHFHLWSWILSNDKKSAITLVQASEMRFLRNIEGVTLINKALIYEIQKSLNIDPLPLRPERSQFRWFGRVSRMPQKRLPKQALLAKANGKRPVGRPRTRWANYIDDFG